jgi:hypothetical protein
VASATGCHELIDLAVGGGVEQIDGSGLWCGLCPRFPATEALHDAARFARRAQRLLEELEPQHLDEFEPTSTCSATPLPTAGWSLTSGVDAARRPRSTAAKEHPEMSAERSRAARAHISENLLYLILKAGPAGGRLRRPSSAGNDTTNAMSRSGVVE